MKWALFLMAFAAWARPAVADDVEDAAQALAAAIDRSPQVPNAVSTAVELALVEPKAKASEPKAPAASAAPPPGVPVVPLDEKDSVELAQRDFARAQSLMASGDESGALTSFTDFLRRYPKNPAASEAQYDVGEIYFRQRQYSEALTEFAKVAAFRQPTKVPDTILRTGECLEKLGQKEKAQIEWNALVRRYPKTAAAEQARVRLKGLP